MQTHRNPRSIKNQLFQHSYRYQDKQVFFLPRFSPVKSAFKKQMRVRVKPPQDLISTNIYISVQRVKK